MSPFQISPLESADRPAVEALLDRVFGRDRRSKSSYRLRADNPPCPALAFAAWMDGRLVGSVQQTQVAVGDANARALLGMRCRPRGRCCSGASARGGEPELRGRGRAGGPGIGRALLRRSPFGEADNQCRSS